MISILIPIYNGVEFINDSVSSVLNQTVDNWELLIGVNGHPQNSKIYQIAKEFETKNNKIKVFDFYNIFGKSNTLNKMVHLCNNDYVALLDVDDMWHPQKLEIQTQFLYKYDVIGSNCVYCELSGNIQGIIPPIPSGNILNVDFSLVNPIINSSSLIKKEFCWWDDNLNGIEDYDLWLRLRKNNKQFYNFKEILVKHRIYNTSAFNSKGNNTKVDDLLISHGFKSRK
jgi:glycosyltransferase involved in cell wall biosynthesis